MSGNGNDSLHRRVKTSLIIFPLDKRNSITVSVENGRKTSSEIRNWSKQSYVIWFFVSHKFEISWCFVKNWMRNWNNSNIRTNGIIWWITTIYIVLNRNFKIYWRSFGTLFFLWLRIKYYLERCIFTDSRNIWFNWFRWSITTGHSFIYDDIII